jgi:putative CocE/NonD family hydrolase
MAKQPADLIFTGAVPPEQGGYPGFNPRTEKTRGMVIEYDVAVPMRDGAVIYVDVYRPDAPGTYPPLIGWGPYGKHGHILYSHLGNTGLLDKDFNEFTKFEAADPVYWCAHGYAIITPDPRGCWACEGDVTFMSEQEVEDIYDLIEWAGTQPWSNGKVGMHGVSYLAWSQWKVAATHPPHLAAINPWEGVSDFYRELFFHGGIPETLFTAMLQDAILFSNTRLEDLLGMRKLHPLYDEYWAAKNADLSKITVPAFVVASWTDHGLHCRGTVEGFKQIGSKDKWLLVHGRKKWWHFYQLENVEKQRQFFNRFLKGIDNHVKDWPKVTIEVRERYYVGETRTENEWPLARTEYTKYFLNAATASLDKIPSWNDSAAKYNVDRLYDMSEDGSEYSRFFHEAVKAFSLETRRVDEPAGLPGLSAAGEDGGRISTHSQAKRATFEMAFSEKTELTGHMNLRLWVQADAADDLDLFVALEKIDTAGNLVPFAHFGNHDDGPIALGWLRASHRELDEQKSTPWQPVLKHARELKIPPGEIVSVDIEILPTSVVFEPGERLRLIVQGSDIYFYPSEGHTVGHLDTVNKGNHIIHTGGRYGSFLLAPVIPAR